MRNLIGRLRRPISRSQLTKTLALISDGDGSTLSLDFTTMGSLDSRFTFTRASTGTYINSAGLVTTMAAASTNDPTKARFDYDPTTLAPRGLLIEGSVTNLLMYSGDWTQSGAGFWSARTNMNTGGTWTGFTAPDNSASAIKLIPNTVNGRHSIENNSTQMNGSTVYTVSMFFKADGYSVAGIVIAGGQTRRNFTLSGAGSLGSQFGLTNTATITPYANGWYRCSVTWTTSGSGSLGPIGVWAAIPQNATTDPATNSWVGDNTSGIQCWGAQVEASSGASSYIPTGSSTVQRAADSIEITGTNFSSWWPNPTTEFSVQWIGDITRSPNTTQFLWLARAGGLSKARGYVTTGAVIRGNSSVTDFLMSPATNAVANTVIKMAMAVKSGDSAMYVNDGTVIGSQTDATTGTTTNHDSLYLNPNGDNFMHIRSFKFWQSRLPNATLQTLVQ